MSGSDVVLVGDAAVSAALIILAADVRLALIAATGAPIGSTAAATLVERFDIEPFINLSLIFQPNEQTL